MTLTPDTAAADPRPWFLAHARDNQHETVAQLNGPHYCRTCGQMEPFGELVYGNLLTEEEVRDEVTRIVRGQL